MAYTDYLKKWECDVLERIVDDALAFGYEITVYDEENALIRKATNRNAILDECGASEVNTLTFSSPKLPASIGMVYLVWGNEPGVTVADHSDNALIRALLAGADKLQEEQAAKIDELTGDAA